MKKYLQFDYIWIPNSLGGHNAPPYEGMRTTIRWQKYLEQFMCSARDIQWETLTFNPQNLQGHATCFLTLDTQLPNYLFQDGELIELLNGSRVLAIGRLTS